MKATFRLMDLGREPLAEQVVTLLGATTDGAAELSTATTDETGRATLEFDRPPLPVLGLRVDDRSVLVHPRVAGDALDLGTLVLADEVLLETTAFPCDGACHGLPVELAPPASVDEGAGDDVSEEAEVEGREAEPVDTTARRSASLAEVVQDTSRQLGDATASRSAGGFQITGATVAIKGVVTTDENDALQLGFGGGDDGAAMSTITLQLTPEDEGELPDDAAGASSDDGPLAPDLRGYTRSLAERKLAARGLRAAVHGITIDPEGPQAGLAGRVVQQRPAPGTPSPAGMAIHLFLGKPAGRA